MIDNHLRLNLVINIFVQPIKLLNWQKTHLGETRIMTYTNKNNKGLHLKRNKQQEFNSSCLKEIAVGLKLLLGLAPRSWSSKSLLCRSYLSLVKKLINNHGPVTAAKRMKEYQNFIIRSALELPVTALSWHKVDKTGWPVILKPFKSYTMSQDPLRKHFIISIFRSSDLMTGIIDNDTSTITEPWQGCERTLNVISVFCKGWGERNWWLKNLWASRTNNNGMRAKGASGPNGSTGTLTLTLDALALNLDRSLKDSVLALSNLTCTPKFSGWISYILKGHCCISMYAFIQSSRRLRELSHGRIAFIPDKGMKTRVVAIGDGFTQVVLQPIHDVLMETLRHMKTSAAFKQTRVHNIIKFRSKHNLFMGSSDATAFTDRFPFRLQLAFLERIIGAKIVIHYKNVIGRTFTVQGSEERISYSTGQPMGFLSSWPLATITHHIVIEYCAKQVLNHYEFKRFIRDGYCVLGDDVVIFHRGVYKMYLSIMRKLGLTLNSNKSTDSKHACEFAKQLFWRGFRVSAITPSSLMKVAVSPTSMVKLLQDLTDLGYSNIPAIALLDLYPKKTWKQLIPFLSNPQTFKFCENLIDWSEAPKGLSPNQYGWVWTKQQFAAALSYAAVLIISAEVKRLDDTKKPAKRVTNKVWGIIRKFYKAHPKAEPIYTRPFYDGLDLIATELSQLRWGEILSYDYQKFVKHIRSLDPDTHLYGIENSNVTEIKILVTAINLLNDSQNPDSKLNLADFDNFEERILQKLLDNFVGSRLWA